MSPLLPPSRQVALEHHASIQATLASGKLGERLQLDDEAIAALNLLIAEMESDPAAYALQFANELEIQKLIDKALDDGHENPIKAIAAPVPPIEHYRSAFPIETDEDYRLRSEEAMTSEVVSAIQRWVERAKGWVASGVRDDTRPLEEWRKLMPERQVAEFDADSYPGTQPARIQYIWSRVSSVLCG